MAVITMVRAVIVISIAPALNLTVYTVATTNLLTDFPCHIIQIRESHPYASVERYGLCPNEPFGGLDGMYQRRIEPGLDTDSSV